MTVPTPIPTPIPTSAKLALSAKFSVLLMTVYVLFGGDAAQPGLSPADLAPRIGVSAPVLPAFPLVLAQAGTRRLLY